MMHHPHLLEILAAEHRSNLLKEAERHRLALQAQQSRLNLASPLKRILWAVAGLLSVRSVAAADKGVGLAEKIVSSRI